MNFSREHFSNISKYLGISFITGSISHGAFSETRSLLTGAFWVLCFVIGVLYEDDSKNTWETIGLGALIAISIGAFTWGLQHFPDSPERSALIVPVGFMLSLFLFFKIHAYTWQKKYLTYVALSSIVVFTATLGIYFTLEYTDLAPHTHSTTEHESSVSHN